MVVVIVAGIAFWAVRRGFGPKKPPPPSDVLEPPQHPRDRR
ncbi:hypothetical protein [Micromonospora sp. NBC_00858]|nr:hypothetical protein OG990_25820 [Micromonospora sp. NBC_00858]